MLDITTAMNVNIATEYKVKCQTENGIGAGIYQWVVSTQDGQDFAFSQHTICRTGELWNKPPVCPWMYCVNADCSICEENWTENFESIVDLNTESNQDRESAIFRPGDLEISFGLD